MNGVVDFIKNIKNNLQNPKKRSITILALYLIFFIFVFVLINGASSSNETVNLIEEQPETIVNNYDLKYTIINSIDTYEITGIHDELGDRITFNGVEYTRNSDNYIATDYTLFSLFNFDLYILNYENINNVTKKDSYLESTTYQDQSTKTVYEITYEELGIENTDKTNITVYKNNSKYITKIELILYDYTVIVEYKKR